MRTCTTCGRDIHPGELMGTPEAEAEFAARTRCNVCHVAEMVLPTYLERGPRARAFVMGLLRQYAVGEVDAENRRLMAEWAAKK